MGKLMNRLFGKEKEITTNDLNNLIGMVENDWLEAKAFDNIKTFSDLQNKLGDLVFKPLIGFLNKLDMEGGLLILGAKTSQNKKNKNKIVSITGVDKNLFGNLNLRDKIEEDILSYPNNQKTEYHLEIEPISLENNKIVYIIEIHNKENSLNYTYYSKSKNEGYIRNGSSTITISLPEFIDLVKKRSSPKVKMNVNCGLRMKPNLTEKEVIANFSYINEGNKIGKNIVSIIEIYMEYREGMNIPDIPVDPTFMEFPETSMQKLDNNPKYIMVKKLQVNLNQFIVSVSYPTVPIQIGNIYLNQSLFGDEKKVIIKAFTYEETSKMEQEFVITLPSEDNNIMPSCESLQEIFNVY